MRFRMDQFLLSLSAGLDAVEGELLGATTNHGKRVAILTTSMGRRLGWSEDELIGLAACSLLHDNALTEHYHAMLLGDLRGESGRSHCIRGEENALQLPFPTDIRGLIKYHHEYSDRSGPFGRNAEEIPLGAQLMALAEDLDTHHNFHWQPDNLRDDLKEEITRKRGSFYSVRSADAMLSVLDGELLDSLQDANIDEAFNKLIPLWVVDKLPSEMLDIAKIVASIIDYKSKFTAKHSLQIANRAFWMAHFYGYDRETCCQVYLAASFHDLGKLRVPTAILEKPGKLTEDEFQVIKNHVEWTYEMLENVEGFEDICRWATSHHRKLDGRGYPKLPDEYLELDFFSKMLTCIDIYQAVRESRPYHDGRTHRQTMEIMWEMAGRGEIDRQITQDLDVEMARFDRGDGDAPSPQEAELIWTT